MKNKKGILFVLLAAGFLGLSMVVPKGWQISGSAPQKYDIGLWKAGGHDGSSNCGFIRANKDDYFESDYGSLIQKMSSQKYLGKRVRMKGFLRTRGVKSWAGFFIRADEENSKEPLSFETMEKTPVKGNTEWKEYQLEMDVPNNASKIAFGAILNGPGIIYFDDISIEEIGASTKFSKFVVCDTTLRREEENLNFEN